MKKKITITIIIIVSLGLILGLIYGDGFYTRTKGLSKEYSTMEELVLKTIKIQYRGGHKDEFNKIFTPDYIEQIDLNSIGFYKKRMFYIINENFMESCKIINENEANVVVEVEDIKGRYIQEISLVKGADGNYLISEIRYDI